MTTLPSLITPTLGKLIPMLGSDKDGEVLAAVNAIARTLKSNKLDWHDLARAIDPDRTDDDDWREDVSYCVRHQDHLTPKQQDFIQTLRYWKGEPTPKQLAWLAIIVDQLRGRR